MRLTINLLKPRPILPRMFQHQHYLCRLFRDLSWSPDWRWLKDSWEATEPDLGRR